MVDILDTGDETNGDNGIDLSIDSNETIDRDRTDGSDTVDNDGRNNDDSSNDGDETTDGDGTDGSNDADKIETTDKDGTDDSNDTDEIETAVNGSIEGGILSGVELCTWTVADIVPFKAPELFNGTTLFPTWDSWGSRDSDDQEGDK